MFKQLRGKATFTNTNDLKATIEFYKAELELKESARNVLGYLGTCAMHSRGACTVLYSTIADKLFISLSTVKRAMKALKEANAINIEHRYSKSYGGGAGASIITILPASETHIATVVDTLCDEVDAYSNNDSSDEISITSVLSSLKISNNYIKNKVAQIIFNKRLKKQVTINKKAQKKPVKMFNWFENRDKANTKPLYNPWA
ncbi:helix-turn-helix domain-containing protein [Brochothrix campestris]|uniref:Helix-turn-helix type 11 domain-containing protein n=1 Tax=Brochothrix campestris FSL F6-1037 TaxID=1265861 RepID=W7CB52_9LIST|nr:helix-turn-helix domain-containing protein [Brochothrix campestris]EUJ34157.1 hypothetical protein BCAMP_12658 [Brochothrix campestris FSL F6-1037]